MTIPVDPAAVTAAWLTDALRANGALTRARVTALDTQGLGNKKGLTGQLARLRLAYDRAEPDAPRTLIAKFSAPDAAARAMVHSLGFYEREVRFYADLAAHSAVRVPRCYVSALDPLSGQALLLLEDLAAARNGSWIAGCSVEEAELAIRAIAALHAAWWRHPQLADMGWLALRGATSVQQTPVFFAQTWDPFLAKLDEHVREELRPIGARLGTHLGWLVTSLYEDAACTLIHNDYQADNLFFAGAGTTLSLTVADWQFMTRGCGVHDIAFFVGGNLDVHERRTHEQRLLRLYHTLLRDNGVQDYPFERCLYEYRLAMLHPLSRLAALLGGGIVPAAHERRWCEVLVPRYCWAVQDLHSLELVAPAG